MKRPLALAGGLLLAWLLLGGSVSQVVNSVAVGSITGLGTSVATALGVNVGTSGAILVKGTSVCGDLSGAGGYCSISAGALTNSITGNVALNNTGTYFDGPVVAQGSTGTWFVSGSVNVTDTGAAATIACKLWDGTTVIAASVGTNSAANKSAQLALSGFIAAPAGNLRISCIDITATTGVIVANGAAAGNKDSTITAFRIN